MSSPIGLSVGLWPKPVAALSLTYVTANRATRSDVIAPTTSLLPVSASSAAALAKLLDQGHDVDNDNFEGRKSRKNNASKARGPGPVSLCVPAAKLNRELAVERKLFLDRLHHERRLRAELEQYAATQIQAVGRGYLTRRRDLRQEDSLLKDVPVHNFHDELAGLQAAELLRRKALLRRQIAQLQRLTDRAAGLQTRRTKVSAASRLSGTKLNAIVIRLQCFIRRYLARKVVRVLASYLREERERQAVVVIQSRFRAHYDRKQLHAAEQTVRNMAATKIQAYVRRRLDQKFVGVVRTLLREASEELGAATKLQNMLRSKIAKQRAIHQKMENASVLVQTQYRRHVTQTVYDQKRHERIDAAVKLQATMRGHRQRKTSILNKYQGVGKRSSTVSGTVSSTLQGRQRTKTPESARPSSAASLRRKTGASSPSTQNDAAAARKIQALHRGRSVRASIRESEQAAVKLQALHRGRSVRASIRESEQAAVKLQAMHRGSVARARYRASRATASDIGLRRQQLQSDLIQDVTENDILGALKEGPL